MKRNEGDEDFEEWYYGMKLERRIRNFEERNIMDWIEQGSKTANRIKKVFLIVYISSLFSLFVSNERKRIANSVKILKTSTQKMQNAVNMQPYMQGRYKR